ncbi:MAG: mannitol-1-phosphate 5-dehydrogenase [bacterium]|nr:mannitol-1-phosphate 5-dehydrogenase [Acidimicrobiia bacterium]MCY4650509.1 mannitol-1-phosphate 5-dehydrogenase [bacterium]
MTLRRVAVFGAGNIGRGLLGWLFGRAGWEVVFVDVFPELVDLINRECQYRVIEVGAEGSFTQLIEGVTAVNGLEDEAIAVTASAEVVCTAVGAGILDRVAPTIAAALSRSDHRIRNVLACENADPNSALLLQHVEGTMGARPPGVGFPETLVDRMVPGSTGEGLDVEVEARFDFKVAKEAWIGEDPGVPGVELVGNLGLYRTRKLWLVNGLHAAGAFLGWHAGHQTVAQAVSDPSIRRRLEEIAITMAAVLSAQLEDWTAEELADYGRYNLQRFESTTLVDPIRRVARNPLRKLGPTERLVSPAREAVRQGLPSDALCDAIVAGLSLDDSRVEGMDEMRHALASDGWRSVLNLGEADRALAEMLENRMAERAI